MPVTASAYDPVTHSLRLHQEVTAARVGGQAFFYIWMACHAVMSRRSALTEEEVRLFHEGGYSNKMRGQREKLKVIVAGELQSRAVEIVDVSEEKRRTNPSPKWRELINPPSPLSAHCYGGPSGRYGKPIP